MKCPGKWVSSGHWHGHFYCTRVSLLQQKKIQCCRNQKNSPTCLCYLAKSGLNSQLCSSQAFYYVAVRLRTPCAYLKPRWGCLPKGCAATLHKPPKDSDVGKPGPMQSNKNIPFRESRTSPKSTLQHKPARMQRDLQALWTGQQIQTHV